MITVYFNPNCSKSRRVLEILDSLNIVYGRVDYLKVGFSKEALVELLKKLNLHVSEIIRTKEQIWRDNFAGKVLGDEDFLEAIVDNPILLQRPILVDGDKAIVARDEERVREFLKH